MRGDRLEIRLFGRLKRLTAFPAMLAGRDHPEMALAIPDDPVLAAGSINVQAYDWMLGGHHVGSSMVPSDKHPQSHPSHSAVFRL
jgi:hypothetical protein